MARSDGYRVSVSYGAQSYFVGKEGDLVSAEYLAAGTGASIFPRWKTARDKHQPRSQEPIVTVWKRVRTYRPAGGFVHGT